MGKSIYSKGQEGFQALLRQRRLKAGLTQQEVADQLERPQSFVAKYERGERRLDVLEFIQVARALGADPVRLLRQPVKDAGL